MSTLTTGTLDVSSDGVAIYLTLKVDDRAFDVGLDVEKAQQLIGALNKGIEELTETPAEAPLLFYRPRHDDAVLCGACGVTEMNSGPAVKAGLRKPFESMQEAVDYLDSESSRKALNALYGETTEASYWTVSERGTCAGCGIAA